MKENNDNPEGVDQIKYQKQGPPKQPKNPAPMFCFLLLIFTIVDIFLVGFQYNTADQRWAKHNHYGPMAVLEVTQVVVAFCVGVLGIFATKKPNMMLPVNNLKS